MCSGYIRTCLPFVRKRPMFRQLLTACAFAVIGAALVPVDATDQPQTRTVFVNAVNHGKGLVSDLGANDVSISENNIARGVVAFMASAAVRQRKKVALRLTSICRSQSSSVISVTEGRRLSTAAR